MANAETDSGQQVSVDTHERKGMGMDYATWIMIGLALALVALAYRRGNGVLAAGLKSGWDTLLGMLPLLLAVFVVVGMANVLLPRELIARWLGGGSGLKGILIASGMGAITPGGPFVSFPLVAALYRAGAGIGPVVAFITAWSLLSISRIPMEIAFVGTKVVLIRVLATVVFPPLAGLIADGLFARFS